ncbi:hypothetical protein [Haladaptatus sp. NG-WS-4]
MSQANPLPSWAVSPETFKSTLGALVTTARENDVDIDRSWTFRYDDAECDDVMVEITLLAPRPEFTEPSADRPSVPGGVGHQDFETVLEDLLTKGQDAGISFDRSWTFRDTNPDSNDVMVEVSRLAKPTC